MDYFLVFFQQYYWFKKSDPIYSSIENTSNLFPILVDHLYKECLSNVRPKLKVIKQFIINFRIHHLIFVFFFQLFKSYDQAKEEVEKLRQLLYPNLNAPNSHDGAGDAADFSSVAASGDLDTITEDAELTDTNNDLTEDTSEAVGESDDEVRGGQNEDDDDEDDDEGAEADERNVKVFFFLLKYKTKMYNFLRSTMLNVILNLLKRWIVCKKI